MKKKFSILLSILLICIFVFSFFVGCDSTNNSGGIDNGGEINNNGDESGNTNTDNNGDNNNPIHIISNAKVNFSSSMFANCHIDLSSVDSLGIVEDNSTKYFVSLDTEGNINDITFLRQNNNITMEIRQSLISAQIDRMYVTEQFTFVMYAKIDLKYPQYEYYPYNYGYACNEFYQSFVICNSSGNIYSLSDLNYGNFTISDRGYMFTTSYPEKYFTLEIIDNNLVSTEIIQNSAINLVYAFTDIFNNMFVAISGGTGKPEGRFFYFPYSSEINGTNYYLGNDGFAYKVTSLYNSNNYLYDVKRINADFSESDVDPSISISLTNKDKSTGYILKNNKLYHISSYQIYSANLYESYYLRYNYNSIPSLSDTLIFENELYYHDDYFDSEKALYHYNLDTQISTKVIIGVNYIEIKNKKLYAYVETVATTDKYEIKFNNSVPSYTLVSTKNYDRNIIVIQPIN